MVLPESCRNVYSWIYFVMSRLGTAGDDDGELKHAHKVSFFCANYVESDSVLKLRMSIIPCIGRWEGWVSDFQATHVRRSQRARRPQLQAWIVSCSFFIISYLAERCQKWRKIPWYHRSISAAYMVYLRWIFCACDWFTFLCRECGTSQERSCARRRFQDKNLNLKSLFSVPSNTCKNLSHLFLS